MILRQSSKSRFDFTSGRCVLLYKTNEEKNYLPAVDGLRAIAVLSVVGFHVGFKALSGGFVGVDIFFVISGFLITGLLSRQVEETSTLDFARFYAKRFKRLMPSLLLTIFVTTILCFFVMFPREVQQFGGSVQASSFAISNFYFLRTTGGYFDPSVNAIPLLHTWSLGVEEQFYFIWPLFLLLVAKYARKRCLDLLTVETVVLACLAFVSFAYCYHFSYSQQSIAFYLMPLRAWEFSIGGIAYAAKRRVSICDNAKNILGLLGLLAVVGAICFIDDAYVFPGLVSLIPCLGSGLLLFSITDYRSQNIFVVRLLSIRPLVWIGLLSYTFYLLHWPLLSIGRIMAFGEVDLSRDLCIAVVALLASAVTYFVFEKPLRYSNAGVFRSNRSTLLVGLLMLLLFGFGGKFIGRQGEGLSSSIQKVAFPSGALGKLPSGRYSYPVDMNYCFQSVRDRELLSASRCSFGSAEEKSPEVLLWGDSHALHAIPMVNELARQKNLKALVRASGGCLPIVGVIPFAKAGAYLDCAAYNEMVMEDVARLAKNGLKAVVMVARWNNCVGLGPISSKDSDLCALFPGHSDVSTAELGVLNAGRKPLDAEGSRLALKDGLSRMVQQLQSLGLRVVLVAPVPEIPFHPQQCLIRNGVSDCRVPLALVRDRRELVTSVFAEISQANNDVVVFDPIMEFCDTKYCYVADQHGLYYGDDNHLTADKAASLAKAAKAVFDFTQRY